MMLIPDSKHYLPANKFWARRGLWVHPRVQVQPSAPKHSNEFQKSYFQHEKLRNFCQLEAIANFINAKKQNRCNQRQEVVNTSIGQQDT